MLWVICQYVDLHLKIKNLTYVHESQSVVPCPLGNLVSKPPFWMTMTMTMMKILRIDDGVDVIFDRAFVVLSHDLSKHFCEKCQTHSQSCIFVMNLGKVLVLQRSGGIIVKDSKNPTLPKVWLFSLWVRSQNFSISYFCFLSSVTSRLARVYALITQLHIDNLEVKKSGQWL